MWSLQYRYYIYIINMKTTGTLHLTLIMIFMPKTASKINGAHTVDWKTIKKCNALFKSYDIRFILATAYFILLRQQITWNPWLDQIHLLLNSPALSTTRFSPPPPHPPPPLPFLPPASEFATFKFICLAPFLHLWPLFNHQPINLVC